MMETKDGQPTPKYTQNAKDKKFIQFMKKISTPKALDTIRTETGGGELKRVKTSTYLQTEIDTFDPALDCDESDRASAARCLITSFLKWVTKANIVEIGNIIEKIFLSYFGRGSNSKAALLSQTRKGLKKLPNGKELFAIADNTFTLVGGQEESKASRRAQAEVSELRRQS